MTVRIALIAGLIAVATATAAHAEDWRYVTDDDGVHVAVDVDAFTGPRTRRVARTLMAQKSDLTSFGYLIADIAVDCDTRTVDAVHFRIFDPQGALRQEVSPPSDPMPVGETNGTGTMSQAACDGEALTGQAFADVPAFIAWVAAQP